MSDIFASICGVCCICCSSSLSVFCMQKGCGSSGGCCCCKARFDDDAFLKEELQLRQNEEMQRSEPAVDASQKSASKGNGDTARRESRGTKSNGAARPKSQSHRKSQPEAKEGMVVPSRPSREAIRDVVRSDEDA